MPYACYQQKYSTLTGRENTAVCGFSMGGRVSLQIGFERPDLFGYIGAFCPAPGLLPYTMNGVTEPGFYTDSTFTLPSEYLNDTYVQITKGFKDDVVKQHPLLYHQALQKQTHLMFTTKRWVVIQAAAAVATMKKQFTSMVSTIL